MFAFDVAFKNWKKTSIYVMKVLLLVIHSQIVLGVYWFFSTPTKKWQLNTKSLLGTLTFDATLEVFKKYIGLFGFFF
jgi:hypothetical protein